MSEPGTTVVALGDDPIDQHIPLGEHRRLLMVKHTLGFNAYCSHLKICRDTARGAQQRAAAAAAQFERSREQGLRRHLDKHVPSSFAAVLRDFTPFDESTRARLRAITCPMELAVEVGKARTALGLPIPVLARPADETYDARLAELHRQAAAADSRR